VGCPAENRKFTYYTSSDDKSKHLLYLCRVTHQFSMAMQPKLAELRKLEEEGKLNQWISLFILNLLKLIIFYLIFSQPTLPRVIG
jgi:hypothetical protein